MYKFCLLLILTFTLLATAKAQNDNSASAEGRASIIFEYSISIGNFSSARAFSRNPSGSIYVTDIEKNEVYKLDNSGNISGYIGGYGWDRGSFDCPSGLLTTMLNIYVADKNNHRVQVFDKDLNYLYMLSGNDERHNSEAGFEYPLSVAVNASGDIFILDSGNKRIIKYDSRGNYLLEFGGYRSGGFQLKNPLSIISYNDCLFCADDSSVVIFDQYGAGLSKYNPGFTPSGIQQHEGYFTIFNSKDINITDLKTHNFKCILMKNNSEINNTEILSALYINDTLLILTKNTIDIYKKKKAE